MYGINYAGQIQDGRRRCTSGQRPLETVFVYARGSIATVPEVVFSRGILGVSIGVRLEGVRVHDAFVKDESVAFGACDNPVFPLETT